MRRGFWFIAGAGAGVYVVVKARRAAEVFTPEGLRDRVAGLTVGAQLFADEVRSGMNEREIELRERFGYGLDGPLMLEPSAEIDAEHHHGSLDDSPAPLPLEGRH